MLDKFFKTIEKITPKKWRWVMNHDGFRRYFANTGWMFFGQMFSLLVSFFIGAWLARYLGPENYGVLNYAVAFAGLFAFVASLGVDSIINREIIKFPDKENSLLGTAFVLKLIGGTLAFSLSCVSAFIFENDPLIRLLIILFSLSFILQSIGVIGNFFQSKVQARNNIKAQLFAMVVSSILKIVLIMMHLGVIWLILVYVLDTVWVGLGYIVVYRKAGLKIFDWKFDKKLAAAILKDSWPLMLSGAAIFIYMKIDQIMIGRSLNSESVGLYSVAIKLSEIWYFIPSIICTSLFPAIINAKLVSQENYHQRLRKLYFLMILIAFVVAVGISIFAKPLILLLFGSAYLLSIPVLKIYIWSGIGIFVSSVVSQYLIAENMVKTVFISSVMGMVANVVLNLILIPKIGLYGAAIASLISYTATPFGILLFDRFLRNKKKVIYVND